MTFTPHGIYATAGTEQWGALACEDEELCQVAGHPEWLSDHRFVTREARRQHEDALDSAIGQWLCREERASNRPAARRCGG